MATDDRRSAGSQIVHDSDAVQESWAAVPEIGGARYGREPSSECF